MDAIGAQEMLRAGADAGRALGGDRPRRRSPRSSTLEDRNGREFILPMTHEETFTFHAREMQSYKQLPQILVPLPDQGPRRAAAARRAASASASSS